MPLIVPLVLVVSALVIREVRSLDKRNTDNVPVTHLVVLFMVTLLEVVRPRVFARLLESTLAMSTLVPLRLPTVLVDLSVEQMASVFVLTVVRWSRLSLVLAVLAPVRIASTRRLKLVVTPTDVMLKVVVVSLVVARLSATSVSPWLAPLTFEVIAPVASLVWATVVLHEVALVTSWTMTPPPLVKVLLKNANRLGVWLMCLWLDRFRYLY